MKAIIAIMAIISIAATITSPAYAQEADIAGFGGLDFAIILGIVVTIPFVAAFVYRAYQNFISSAEKASEDRARERFDNLQAESRAREDAVIQRNRYLGTIRAGAAGQTMAGMNETEEQSKQSHQAPTNYIEPTPTESKTG